MKPTRYVKGNDPLAVQVTMLQKKFILRTAKRKVNRTWYRKLLFELYGRYEPGL
jgi:hypothetical protein